MIRSELIQKISEENPHLFQRDVERIVNTVFEEVIDAMARGLEACGVEIEEGTDFLVVHGRGPGGVPGGAFLGEIFIVTTLGLPMEAIPMLVVLGTITDAPATLINVIHDLNAAQIVERFAGKKQTNTEINSTAAVV